MGSRRIRMWKQKMDTEGKILDILYRQISPERVLHGLKQRITGESGAVLTEKALAQNRAKLFVDFAESSLDGYSENEQRMFYSQLSKRKSRWERQTAAPDGFLWE